MKEPLGPARARDLSPKVESFVAALPEADRKRLAEHEGFWPEYPLLLHEIARERNLALPDLGLPGDPRLWEAIRARGSGALPDPPERLLRAFAIEYNRKNADGPRLSPNDPAGREALKRKFYEAHPEMRRPTGPDRPRPDRKKP